MAAATPRSVGVGEIGNADGGHPDAVAVMQWSQAVVVKRRSPRRPAEGSDASTRIPKARAIPRKPGGFATNPIGRRTQETLSE
jgi:hypothetical protein